MKKLFITFSIELMKIKKSKVLWITILVFIFIPAMMSLLFYIARNPEMANKLGLIGTKASIFGNGDWNAYLDLLVQVIAGIGLVGFGFVTSWIFGREYAERTLNDLLALPISRTYIVISKIFISFLISMALAIVMIITGIIMGLVVQISGWSQVNLYSAIYKILITSLLTVTLSTPVAFIASYGRGYLLPIGFVILTMILAQLCGAIGINQYFPWSIPGVYSMYGTPDVPALSVSSYVILFTTSIAGLAGTIGWWRFADQK